MGTMLENVKQGARLLPPRIVIHGKGGAGKTELGVDVPGAIFLPAEEGLGNRSVATLPKPNSFGDVMDCIRELATEEHGYRALVIDTVDKIEPLVWDYVVETQGAGKKSHIEDFGYGKGYIFADVPWVDFFVGLDHLRDRGMTTLVLCHNEVKTINDPSAGPYDSYQPKLHKRANALLYEWADVVGFLEVEKASIEKEAEKGGRKVHTAASTGRRLLHLENWGGAEAKNRYALPPRLEIPAEHPYQPLREAIRAAFNQSETPAPAGNEEEAA